MEFLFGARIRKKSSGNGEEIWKRKEKKRKEKRRKEKRRKKRKKETESDKDGPL